MASIYFCSPPFRGHVGPTVPIAKELARRGHQVLFLNSGEMCQDLLNWGLPVHDCARAFGLRDHYGGGAAAELLTMQEHLSVAFAAAKESYGGFRRLFLEARPDLVVLDELSLGPQYACELQGVPFASSLITLPMLPRLGTAISFLHSDGGPTRSTFELVREMRAFREAAGIPRRRPDPTNHSELLCLVFTSREFHPAGEGFDARYQFVGASMDDQDSGSAPGDEAPGSSETRRILVSLGTVYNRRTELYRIILEAFRDRGLQVLLATGNDVGPGDLNAFA